jgi:hypothetical protein
MKKMIRFLSLACLALPLLMVHCTNDEPALPAPQITSDKSTLDLVPEATGKATLIISAPANLSSVTAVADQGTVAVENITGLNTTVGGAEINYTAPLALGNYKITVTATDAKNQSFVFEITVVITTKPPVPIAAGNVEGRWIKGTTYIAGGDLTIAAGKTLTIEEGVTVIFDGDGSATAPQFTVRGNLYSYGTKDRPVKFTIPEAKRTKENIFAGLWGGIQCTIEAAEVALIYTNIEFAGATVGAGNPLLPTATAAYPYVIGDERYGFFYSNTNGKLVMQNSRIAYTKDEGMRVTGGTILITNNLYELTGGIGGESVNLRSSVTGDVAYNVAYRPAANGFKWSNHVGTSANPQTDANFYNNTCIECGWRQLKTGRGGSFNIERGARGKIYNNLIVNSKFGVRVVTDADVVNVSQGFNGFYANEQIMVDQFYVVGNAVLKGDKETTNDLTGAVGTNDPKFVNYNVTTFVSADNILPTTQNFMPVADFRLQATSPFLNEGKVDFTTKNASLTVDGKTYTVPAPSSFIGAFGTTN